MAVTEEKPEITITYCTLCHWMLRGGWLAQELLSTFGEEIGKVSLAPARGGIFTIHYNEILIWDRSRDGGFPDSKTLKKLVRDQRDPGRDLGHLDRDAASTE